jgi:pseudaminic acid synthase
MLSKLSKVFCIAELSANHGQDKSIALKTIEAAAKSGADAIKIQTYTPDTMTLNIHRAPFLVKTDNAWSGRSLYHLYQEAMTPWEWHAELKEAAESYGLVFFSTPFDFTAVDFLENLNVPLYKIASFEIVDIPLIKRVARLGKPIIISTGMASLEEIRDAVDACYRENNYDIALLRCVSAYPAPLEEMNLSSLEKLKEFGAVVGLSDHTLDSTAAVTAVALGAKIVEKHFILDRNLGGPDSFFSLEPAEFKAMVEQIRAVEKALGEPKFGPSPSEQGSLLFRRSIFFVKDMRVGEVITEEHVRSIRPAMGLSPAEMPSILGRRVRQNISAGTPLNYECLN